MYQDLKKHDMETGIDIRRSRETEEMRVESQNGLKRRRVTDYRARSAQQANFRALESGGAVSTGYQEHIRRQSDGSRTAGEGLIGSGGAASIHQITARLMRSICRHSRPSNSDQ